MIGREIDLKAGVHSLVMNQGSVEASRSRPMTTMGVVSLTLRQYVEAILLGDERAAVPRPRLEPCDLETLANAVRSRANRPRAFPDPRHTAVALGLRLVPRAPPGFCGEATARGVIAFRWDACPQLRGLRILHGIAHAVLDTESGSSTDADAWLFTGALAIGESSVDLARRDPTRPAAHVPDWFVCARIFQAKLCRAAGL